MIFDFNTRPWSVLAVMRVGIRNRNLEQVASLQAFQMTGY